MENAIKQESALALSHLLSLLCLPLPLCLLVRLVERPSASAPFIVVASSFIHHPSSPIHSVMSLSTLNNYWEKYLECLEKKPVETKAVTAGVLSVVSDVLAQKLAGTPLSNLNLDSVRNQFIIGLLIRGPLVHYWYKFMEYLFRRLGYSAAQQQETPVVVGKVLLDQTVFSIPFNLLYFYAIGAMEGRPTSAVNEQVSREFMPLMIANYKVWPLVNLLNFKVIPPKLQVLFGNLVSIAWMSYVILSTRAKQ